MKYIINLNSHTEYENITSVDNPTVVYDSEHLHYINPTTDNVNYENIQDIIPDTQLNTELD